MENFIYPENRFGILEEFGGSEVVDILKEFNLEGNGIYYDVFDHYDDRSSAKEELDCDECGSTNCKITKYDTEFHYVSLCNNCTEYFNKCAKKFTKDELYQKIADIRGLYFQSNRFDYKEYYEDELEKHSIMMSVYDE